MGHDDFNAHVKSWRFGRARSIPGPPRSGSLTVSIEVISAR